MLLRIYNDDDADSETIDVYDELDENDINFQNDEN